MRVAPWLLGACSLAAQAAGLPQHLQQQAQTLRLEQTEAAGLRLSRQAEPLQPSAGALASGEGKAGTASAPARASLPPLRARQTAAPAPLDAPSSRPAHPPPDPRERWLTLLAEAERNGVTPAFHAQLDGDAAWLEAAADADLLQRLGWRLLEAGQAEQAERWFSLALERDAGVAAARLGLAQSLARRGALAEAHALLAGLPEAARQRRDLADALAVQAQAAGDATTERHWLLAALTEDEADLGLRERLAWNAQRRQDWDEAVAQFRRLLAAEDRPPWREGLAAGLEAQGALTSAYQTLLGLPSASAWRLSLASTLAEAARRQNRLDSERDWLFAAAGEDAANASLGVRLARNAEARGDRDAALHWWARAYALQPDLSTAEAYAQSVLESQGEAALARLAEADDGPLNRWWRTRQARRLADRGLARAAARTAPPGALPELAGALAPRLGLGLGLRHKDGSDGGSRLRLRMSPQLKYAGPHAGGWFEAVLSGVSADAGTTTPSLPYGAAVAGQGPVPTRVGAAGALQLRWTPLAAAGPVLSLGSSALDAPTPATPTFSLGWRDTQADHAWRAALYREPVRDSVLSLLGQRDPASGQAWGRVMRNGLMFGAHRQLAGGPWHLAGELRLERLDGRAVADNHHYAAALDLMHELAREGYRYLQLGPVLGWEGYRRDLSGYTWGHGGYFSPRQFLRLGLGLQFETADRPDWRLAGRLSGQWQQVKRKDAPCHPLPPPAGPSICGVYPGERKQGLAAEAELRAATRLGARWQLAAALGYRHGPAYRDAAVGLTLYHLFEPQAALHAEDLPKGLDGLW